MQYSATTMTGAMNASKQLENGRTTVNPPVTPNYLRKILLFVDGRAFLKYSLIIFILFS